LPVKFFILLGKYLFLSKFYLTAKGRESELILIYWKQIK